MKKAVFITLFAFMSLSVFSQHFYFKCHYKNGIKPYLYFYPQQNVFEDAISYTIPLIKDTDSSVYANLNPSRINFLNIGFDPILECPGDSLEGTFDGSHFQPKDSNTINFNLLKIAQGFSKIVVQYPVGGDYLKFKSLVGLLRLYIDSTNNEFNNNIRPWQNEGVNIAMKEYLCMRLAHFLVLPILFKNNYDKNELNAIIHKDIQIKYPEYWLQIQPGRIFLKTYYQNISLPNAHFSLEKSVMGKYYSFYPIHKLVSYYYFLECLKRAVVKTKLQLLSDWKRVNSNLILSTDEREMMETVRVDIQKLGANISDVFASLPLTTVQGKLLNAAEKKALISGPNIILDFWASWCVPCRKRMKEIMSDRITIDNKQFQIIYISLDENENLWKGAEYPFLNKNNSFKIADPNNAFVKYFKISAIPRAILIDKSRVMSQEFKF